MEIVSITETARARMLSLLEAQGETTVYLTLNNKGCGGNSYAMGIIDAAEVEPIDQRIQLDETHEFVVDGKTAPMMMGVQVDWIEDQMSGRFVFDNPNATGSCGCGSSFTTGGGCS